MRVRKKLLNIVIISQQKKRIKGSVQMHRERGRQMIKTTTSIAAACRNVYVPKRISEALSKKKNDASSRARDRKVVAWKMKLYLAREFFLISVVFCHWHVPKIEWEVTQP